MLYYSFSKDMLSSRISLPGISMKSQPQCTKVIFDFDKIFSICRALNSKHFDKRYTAVYQIIYDHRFYLNDAFFGKTFI